MREILFRGKRKDIGKWIEGSLLNFRENTYIIPHDSEYCYDDAEKLAFDVEYFEVLPETVGQFTGFCDKKGRKIFENDIVRVYYYKLLIDECIDYNGVVEYTPEGFGIFHDSSAMLHAYLNEKHSNEIIGNIYDNPELLHIDDLEWH